MNRRSPLPEANRHLVRDPLVGSGYPQLRVALPRGEFDFRVRTALALALLLGAIIVAATLYPPSLIGSLAVVAMYGLLSTESALKALALIYLIRALNPAFTDEPTQFGVSGILAVLLCSLRIYADIFRFRLKLPTSFKFLALYVATAGILALFASDFVTVSVFKLTYFFVVAGAILAGFAILSQRGTDIAGWIFGLYCAVAILSAPLVIHSFGYFRDGEGFQGILSHPQEYAIFIAPLAAMLLAQLLTSKRHLLFVVLLLAYVILSLVFTRARTSILALLLGLVVGYLIESGKLTRSGAAAKTLLASVLAGTVMVLLGAAAYVAPEEDATAFLRSFLFKGADGAISDAFEASRGMLMTESVENFIREPVAGVGFGINKSEIRPSEPVYDTLTGLPISFPTEKANLVVALLEETGVIGFLVFSIFAFRYVQDVRNRGRLVTTVAAFTAFFTNVGEMTFFSMNSFGLFTWILVGLATYRYAKK